MPKFRKKPVEIEALRYMGPFSIDEMHEAWGQPFVAATVVGQDGMSIKTIEGILFPSIGDWIIRGVKGEFYPIRDDIFRQTYEPVS